MISVALAIGVLTVAVLWLLLTVVKRWYDDLG